MVCWEEEEVKEVVQNVVGELKSSRICLFIHVQACNALKNKKNQNIYMLFPMCTITLCILKWVS